MQWRLIILLTLMLIVVIFSLTNAEEVPFKYVFGEQDISLALIIIISALIGAVAMAISGLSAQMRLGRKIKEKEQEIRQLNLELEELKAPSKEDS